MYCANDKGAVTSDDLLIEDIRKAFLAHAERERGKESEAQNADHE